jgi:hypothetical protein
MKIILAGLVTALVLAVVAEPSMAKQHRRHYGRDYNSPSAIAERQRHARTFDENQYYEHILSKIPLGTRAWWDQYDRERGGGGNRN